MGYYDEAKVKESTENNKALLIELKKKANDAYRKYFIIEKEFEFRNHLLGELKYCIDLNENVNNKTLVGSYLAKNNIKISLLEIFSELSMPDFAQECKEVGELADLLKKESISETEANNAVNKFKQYEFKIDIDEGNLRILTLKGQCLPLGDSYDDEYHFVKIK